MKTKEITVIVFLVIVVLGMILFINYVKANGDSDEKTMKCIAEKSQIVVSKTCSACAYQKEILGGYAEYFELIDFSEHPEIIEQYSITGVPTWIINNQAYPKVKSIEQLKELTGC